MCSREHSTQARKRHGALRSAYIVKPAGKDMSLVSYRRAHNMPSTV